MCSKNLKPNTLPQQDNEPPALVRQIGKTTYRVRIRFSATSRESMSDIIKRMLKNEVRSI